MAPFTLISIGAGYLCILRHMNHTRWEKHSHSGIVFHDVAVTLIPIVILVILSFAGNLLLPFVAVTGPQTNMIGMTVGLLLGLVLIYAKSWSVSLSVIKKTLNKGTYHLLILVLGVRFFSAALKTTLPDGNTIVSLMRDEIITLGVPIIVVIMIITFISGLVTGVAVGFTGASFPLVFALVGESSPLHVLAATTALAFGFGYMGMIVSPIHVCLVVSNEYFKSKLFRVYRYLYAPVSLVIIATLLLALLYYYGGHYISAS